MVAENLKLARERQTKQKPYHQIKLKTEDMVMIKTHADGQFQPIYKGYYGIVKEINYKLCLVRVENHTLCTLQM